MTKTFIHNNELSKKRLTWCIIDEQDNKPGFAFLYPQAIMQKDEFSNYIDFDDIKSYLKGKDYQFIRKKSETEYTFANKPICDYYKRRNEMSEEYCDNFAEYITGNKKLCSKHYESA